MKRMKHWLAAGFFILCAVCAAAVTILVSRTGNAVYEDFDSVSYDLTDTIQWMILSRTMELDPDYQPLIGLDEDAFNEIGPYFQERCREAVYRLDNDVNFSYRIEKDGKEVSSRFDQTCTEDNAMYYAELTYDENGNLTQTGNMDRPEFSFLSLGNMYTLYELVYSETDQEADVQLNAPQDLKVTLYIPKTVRGTSGIVYQSIYLYYNNSMLLPILFIGLVSGAGVLILYILLVPYKELGKSQPFAVMRSWKAEWNVTVILMGGTLFGILSAYYMSFAYRGGGQSLLSGLGIPAPSVWIDLCGFILVFLTLFFAGIGAYYLKYALCSGFTRFLKEDVWITGKCMQFWTYIQEPAHYDLDHKLKTLIRKGCLLNAGILLLLVFLHEWIIALIYGVASYFFLLHQANRITGEYEKILARIDHMTSQNFDSQMIPETALLPSLQEKLDRLEDDFEDAVKERVRSQNLRTELITNVSHDLKTPLTGMKNYLEILQDPDLSEKERAEYVRQMLTYTDRLSKLIEDLFEVSKVNSGNVSLEKQEIDLAALVEQVLVENESLLEKKGLTPVIKKPEGSWSCLLDGSKTVRIFENLLSNAGKYALENTRLFITFEKVNAGIRVVVQNISKTPLDFDPEAITERFVRADRSRHEEGSGLGLAIVKSFCEIQGGTFEIQLDGDVFKAILVFTE